MKYENIDRVLKLIIVITAMFMLVFSVGGWIKDSIYNYKWEKEMIEMGKRGLSPQTRGLHIKRDTTKQDTLNGAK
jgi:hypothetical protein